MSLHAALLVATCLAGLQDFSDFGRLPPEPPEDPVRGPDWLLVRAETDGVEGLSWERIAVSYLTRSSRRIVPASEGQLFPASNRLVIGTPWDNALVQELAPTFGLTFEANLMRFRGRELGRDVGLMVCGADPDGGGLVTLVTGLERGGVHACFTVSLDLARPSYAIVRPRRVLEAGPLVLGADLSAPQVVDLDLVLRASLAALGAPSEGEARLAAARALEGWAPVVEAVAGARVDLYEHLGRTLVPPVEAVREARARFASRDPAAEIAAAHRALVALLGEEVRGRPAPAFHLLYDLPRATNARSFGVDLSTGRPRVALNLTALTAEGALRAAAIHESVHGMQRIAHERLEQEAVPEGVAVLLTALAAPELPLTTALMWSPEELAAAEGLREELVQAFLRDAVSMNPRVQAAWMRLDSPTVPLPGAPARAAYWVAYLAARAWLDADPTRRPVDLLEAPTAALVDALR